MTLSARNHLKGTIDEIQFGDVLAHVTMRVGENEIESVITRRSAEEICEIAVRQGMRRLRDDGLEKARQGITSIAEVLRVVGSS